jgi:ABC-type amino acid transport substrate-binding protein
MIRKVLAIAAVALLATPAVVSAHEHKVMGTVTMAAADHLMMKTTDGHDVTVRFTRDTKITKDKEAVKPDAIKEGTRVVVTTASDADPYTAMAIQVGAAAKPVPPKTTR